MRRPRALSVLDVLSCGPRPCLLRQRRPRRVRADAPGRAALSAGRARLRAGLTTLAAGCGGLGPCPYSMYCPAALGLSSFASVAPDAPGLTRRDPRAVTRATFPVWMR